MFYIQMPFADVTADKLSHYYLLKSYCKHIHIFSVSLFLLSISTANSFVWILFIVYFVFIHINKKWFYWTREVLMFANENHLTKILNWIERQGWINNMILPYWEGLPWSYFANSDVLIPFLSIISSILCIWPCVCKSNKH